MHIEDNVRAGMTPEEARRQALIKLGGVEQTKENYRDRRGLPWLETLIRDVRFGLRMLAKAPALTFILVFTLALGIGVNSAVFSVVNGFLLRPLPVAHPEQIVVLASHQQGAPLGVTNVSYADLSRFSQARRGCILRFVRICAVPCRAQRRRPRPPDHGELRFRKLFFGPGA